MRYALSYVCKTHNKMKLKEFLNSLPRGKKSEFASQVGIDPVYLSQIAADDQGPRKFRASAALAVRIEKFSNGVVNRSDLRPDDWQEIWPELIVPGAPTAPAATESVVQKVAHV